MKQIFTIKNLLLATSIAAVGVANGQVYHPLAFGAFPVGTAYSDPNFYKDYVGVRFMVNSPAVVAGEKVYTFANSGTTPWGGPVPTGASAITNMQICMVPPGGDTLALSGYTAGSMAGKVAVVFRGSNEFVCKAVNVQPSGAAALIIVNHSPGGPIGMGAGTVCSTTGLTTFPVFMISKEDGDAIVARYRANDTARVTIVPWGLGANSDLGFVPSGGANWHNFAIPANQLHAGSGNPHAYKMADGAFIANYGTADQTNVHLNITTSFTPTGGSSSTVHTNTVTMNPFPVADSIYALFPKTEYDLTGTGTGRYDIKYDVSSPDMADDNMADNSITNSFYVTDSVYCKGRYDFVNNKPLSTIGYSFGGGAEFMWGPMYYVKNGGTSLSRVQYSLSINGGGALSGTINLFLYKWNDGAVGGAPDSVVQNGELELKSLGLHTLDGGINDTSGALLNFWDMGNTSGEKTTVMLDADSWYYLAVGVPASHFLGSDGIMNPYTRIFGRFHSTGQHLDYSSLVNLTPDDISADPTGSHAVMPATFTTFIGSIDSFNYNNTRGVIPNVAMIANNNPPEISVPSAPVVAKNKVTTFPNPAKDQLNVSVSFEKASKKVTYFVVDGLGRYMSKEIHENVKSETFTLNTSTLASGSYYLIVNTDDKAMASQFVIIK